jgi:hypothetical protein
MMWTALPPLPQHDLRVSRKESEMKQVQPHVVMQRLDDDPDDRWIFTKDRVWIERRDGWSVEERSDPRAAFAGHRRETPWDRLHLTYFLGYAVWNYLAAPFLFAWPGFNSQELDRYVEGRETWRVLEVTYPDNIPAHTKRKGSISTTLSCSSVWTM